MTARPGPTDAAAEADARPDDDEASWWECARVVPEVGDPPVPGTFLDLTQTAEMQTGDGSPSSIRCFKLAESGNSSPGGIWFKSWSDPEAPGSGAFHAAGQPFVLESPLDDDRDITVTPPLAKQIGDTVGPDDEWVSGEQVSEFDHGGVRVGHIQDPGDETALDQIWFMSGIVGVRFTAEDGVHYGFVELEFLPDAVDVWSSDWLPVPWGYRAEPDEPLTIPPP